MSKCRDGFGLFEAAASLFILGAVSVAAITLVSEELRTARRTASTLEASALAEDLLFRAEFIQWDSLTSYGQITSGRFIGPMDRYSWELDVAPSPQDSGLYDATARVFWPGGAYAISSRFIMPPAALAPVPGDEDQE